MPTTKIGDRIELLEMPDDPDPVPVGTQGTVMFIFGTETLNPQYDVRWDNGRTLMLIGGIDRWKVVGTAPEEPT